MSLESLFLISDVPGDAVVAAAVAVGGPLFTAIAVLYRRQVVLEDRAQANIERVASSAYATADALDKLTETIKGAINAVGK